MTEKQRQENLIVEKKRNQIMNPEDWRYPSTIEQLNKCNAMIFNTEKYLILQSYQTIVAAIDKENETCYDWLRLVYGYTATSVRQIRKFMNKYGIVKIKRWRE